MRNERMHIGCSCRQCKRGKKYIRRYINTWKRRKYRQKLKNIPNLDYDIVIERSLGYTD